jgi:1,4-alpha-glucan branching enzyme
VHEPAASVSGGSARNISAGRKSKAGPLKIAGFSGGATVPAIILMPAPARMARALIWHLTEGMGSMTSITQDGQVEFRFFRRGVRSVTVVGDFDGWGKSGLPMSPVGDGWWMAQVRFDAGEYRFRYVADGTWFSDYAAQGLEMTKTGFNSILIIPEKFAAAQSGVAKRVA